ncbi:MAG: sigma-E processing peptidase SpoIIGA [Clostridia bacterium]|nr:sigma-E processing peptidase SpoIIGA [Clostridia bacterium]
MTISVELFLLDNMLMNYLVLRLASVLCGKRLRAFVSLPAALLGALYALLSMSAAPILSAILPKLGFGALLALCLSDRGRGYLRALIALYLSAFLLGGVAFGVTLLVGGRLSGGALMGTVPLRAILVTAALCAALPRAALSLIAAYRGRTRHVRVRVELSDRAFIVQALVDSGNLLREPVSGLPVVLIRQGLLPKASGRPVPYMSLGGSGFLNALRPVRISVQMGAWYEIDAYVAEADYGIGPEEAVIGTDLLQRERGYAIDDEARNAAWEAVPADTAARQEEDPVYALGGDAADAVSGGGGGEMDRKAHAGR